MAQRKERVAYFYDSTFSDQPTSAASVFMPCLWPMLWWIVQMRLVEHTMEPIIP